MGRPLGSKNRKTLGPAGDNRAGNNSNATSANATSGNDVGTGTGAEKIHAQGHTRSDMVEVPVEVPLEVPVTVPEPTPSKTKRVRKSKKAQLTITPAQVSSVIIEGSKLIAKRAGELWIIDSDEAKLIGDPLACILSRVTFISKHSDEAMLLFALSAVFVPRIYTQLAVNNLKKGGKVENVNKKGTVNKHSRGNKPDITASTSSDSASRTASVFPVFS